jgi:hypothetical protein
MPRNMCPVLIEMEAGRLQAAVKVPRKANPVEVSLALRDKGWSPWRIWFDPEAGAWIASVIYRAGAA